MPWIKDEIASYKEFPSSIITAIYDKSRLPPEDPEQREAYLLDYFSDSLTPDDYFTLESKRKSEGRAAALTLLESWVAATIKEMQTRQV